MSTSHILTLLVEERDRIQAAISALGHDQLSGLATGKRLGRPPAKTAVVGAEDESMPNASAAPESDAPKKRKMSAAGRRAIREGVRKRWAAVKAAKIEAAAPKKTPAKKSAVLAAITPPAEDTDFKARMSAAMKKAWAKRRKAAMKK